MKNQERLKSENCNKSHCKSCIFHPNVEQRVKLSAEREQEIKTYLMAFQSSHVCHCTEKTCYGALELQAQTAHILKITPSPTVESFLETAKKYLK